MIAALDGSIIYQLIIDHLAHLAKLDWALRRNVWTDFDKSNTYYCFISMPNKEWVAYIETSEYSKNSKLGRKNV